MLMYHIYRYVAEMMNNRILRFFQQPPGVYHGSVFCQLAGSVGPSCLAIDSVGNLYVGQYDLKSSGESIHNVVDVVLS